MRFGPGAGLLSCCQSIISSNRVINSSHTHTCFIPNIMTKVKPKILRLDDWAEANSRLLTDELAEEWGRGNLKQGTFPRGQEGKPLLGTCYLYDSYLKYYLTHASPKHINLIVCNSTQMTPLLLACSLGLVNKLEIIIHNKFLDVNQKSAQGKKTALHCAVTSGNTEVIKILATHPKLVWNEKDERGFTPIFYAAREEKSEMLEAFLPYSGIDWNMTFGKAERPLPYLIMNWRRRQVEDGYLSSAEEYLKKMNVLLNAPLSCWNDTTTNDDCFKDDERGKTVLVRALEVEEMESLVVIFKNPNLIYDIKAAKNSRLITPEFVTKCIDRIKEENKRIGMNFSDAFNYLNELLYELSGKTNVEESPRVKTKKIDTKRGASTHIVVLNPDSVCIDALTKLLCNLK